MDTAASAAAAGAPEKTDPVIGQAGQPIIALCFPGGRFDTIVQLGVIHALLVSGRRPPDVVAGISLGAINATALAEIMQAGEETLKKAKEPTTKHTKLLKEARQQQAARFREFLNAYRTAPARFRRTLIDPYEIDAHAPLKPLELPLHAPNERKAREDAVASSSGLIRLANDLLSLRYSVSAFTRLVRRVLGFRATGDMPLVQRFRNRTAIGLQMLVASFLALFNLAPLAGQIVMAIVATPSRRSGRTAAALISRPRRFFRRVARGSQNTLGLAVLVIVWMFALLVWIVHACVWVLLEIAQLVGIVRAGAPRVQVGRVKLAQALRNRKRFRRTPRWVLWRVVHRLLARYDLARSLGQTDALRETLVDLFDRNYDGRLNLTQVIAKALRNDSTPTKRPDPAPRTFDHYDARDRVHPVTVAAIATDLADGLTRAIPGWANVVDGLLAATASPPFFPPVDIQEPQTKTTTTYIDATRVANEPIAAVVDYLRDRAKPESNGLHIYPVRPFPESAPTGAARAPSTGLVDIVRRALVLRGRQTATLERDLTELYTKLVPQDQSSVVLPASAGKPARRIWRARIFPIATAEPASVNWQLFTSSRNDTDRILFAAVAAGCRTTMEALAQAQVAEAGGEKGSVRCWDVQQAWATLERRGWEALAGGTEADGPGVAEVCKRCTCSWTDATGKVVEECQSLGLRPQKPVWPLWPAEFREAPQHVPQTDPRDPDLPSENQEPWVSMLFSGGVFRGVFQVGVLNAVNEAGLRPDLLAGSSVGSIMAAMARKLFREKRMERRVAGITSVAATFLALDRLVLTDRFSDLVRRLTIRAAETNWSLRDLDEVLRRYDAQSSGAFIDDLKRVAAGLERLFYVSPFDLQELVHAFRDGDRRRSVELVDDVIQEFLDRNGTTLEILGAEPLALLVTEHVLEELARAESQPFPDTPPFLLVTTTNLTKGQLEMIGDGAALGKPKGAMLLNALLASSAFPGVFRPRRSSEVFPLRFADEQYVDGGLMDNLPLSQVHDFLAQACQAGLIARRPEKGPHLLLTASLEPRYRRLSEGQRKHVKSSWILLNNRVKQMTYNRKADAFASAQDHFRALYKQYPSDSWIPVDLKVATVKPVWLCHTFGFHPMLGFRRRRQAESIAHGCASTFVKLHSILTPKHEPLWRTIPWPIQLDMDPNAVKRDEDMDDPIPNPQRGNRAEGDCWFRTGRLCPFSRQGLESAGVYQEGECAPIRDSLALIYLRCGDPRVHARRASSEAHASAVPANP